MPDIVSLVLVVSPASSPVLVVEASEMPKTPNLYSPSGQCCELDEPYQAPPGTFDQPFIYAFSADAPPMGQGGPLPNGSTMLNANIKTFSGPDFLLRRLAGMDRVCTQFQFRDVLARLDFNSPVNTSGLPECVEQPEILFPSASGITFDLINVQKAVNTSGAFLSQVIFQGVRRFKGYRRPPSYPYWEDDYTYVFDLAVNWPLGTSRTFSKTIFDNDFELLEIKETILNPVGGGPPCAPGLGGQALKLQLYDQVNEIVFSEPIIDDLLVSNSTTYQSISPVPGIVYRIGQAIKFDAVSLMTPGSCAVQVQLAFHGVRRRPC